MAIPIQRSVVGTANAGRRNPYQIRNMRTPSLGAVSGAPITVTRGTYFTGIQSGTATPIYFRHKGHPFNLPGGGQPIYHHGRFVGGNKTRGR